MNTSSYPARHPASSVEFATNGRAVQRILRALRDTPGLSKEQIAERAFVGKTTLSGGGYLKEMKDAGLIYISGWERNGSGGFTTALYSAGRGDDHPRPEITEQNRNAPGMTRLAKAIEEFGPISYRQAARLAELSPNTVKNAGYLEALVAQQKIHLAGWRRSRNGPMQALYAFGPGMPAPKPLALSQTKAAKRHRASQGTPSQQLAAQFTALARYASQMEELQA